MQQVREWVDRPWQQLGLAAPVFEEECKSVTELALAVIRFFSFFLCRAIVVIF